MSATPLAKARAKKAAETALPPEAYRQAVDQADLAISITDAKANILFANEAFTRVTGYGKEEIVGKNEAMLSNHTTPPELYKTMWADLSAQKPWTLRRHTPRHHGDAPASTPRQQSETPDRVRCRCGTDGICLARPDRPRHSR